MINVGPRAAAEGRGGGGGGGGGGGREGRSRRPRPARGGNTAGPPPPRPPPARSGNTAGPPPRAHVDRSGGLINVGRRGGGRGRAQTWTFAEVEVGVGAERHIGQRYIHTRTFAGVEAGRAGARRAAQTPAAGHAWQKLDRCVSTASASCRTCMIQMASWHDEPNPEYRQGAATRGPCQGVQYS